MHNPQLRKKALQILIFIFATAIAFHLCVLNGFIDPSIVWGGRLETQEQFYAFETISILLNIFFLIFSLMSIGLIKSSISDKIIRRVFYAIAALFLVNTLGNVFAQSLIERTVFTGLTLILSILSYIVAKK